MPTSFNKRNKEKQRQERQADKRLRRDERRNKRNLPPEETAAIGENGELSESVSAVGESPLVTERELGASLVE